MTTVKKCTIMLHLVCNLGRFSKRQLEVRYNLSKMYTRFLITSCEDNEQHEQIEPVVLVHGGAGDIPSDRHPRTLEGVKAAANAAYKVLLDGGSVVDAVECAVRCMEDNEMFNAGYGSVLNLMGEVEMDASIMVGSNLEAGGVTIVQNIANPINLARLVMERTPHILLGAKGAQMFAQDQNISLVPEGGLVTLFSTELLKNLSTSDSKSQMKIGGTVGCVAIDQHGHLAAATSTGGLNGKMVGRCSDSSQIGSGTYADDNLGAVSSTGHGESISRYGLARVIVTKMGNESAAEAVHFAVKDLTDRFKNGVGAIALSKTGEVALDFSTAEMPWAYRKGDNLFYGIKPNENQTEVYGQKRDSKDEK